MKYLAHENQSLEEHLAGVAEKSGNFASKIGLQKHGELVGLLHDIGKYSEDFQNYLQSAVGILNLDEDDYINAKGVKGKIDHSTAGAKYVFNRLSDKGNESKLAAQILSMCIASHHSGLIDCLSPDSKDVFTARMNKAKNKTHYDEAILRADRSVLKRVEDLFSSPAIIETLIKNLKEVHDKDENSPITTHFKQGMLIRILFSCLIDADRLDTADSEKPQLAKLRSNGRYRSWDDLIGRLEKKLEAFQKHNNVDMLRAEISDHCLRHAGEPKGIYFLTVPTGGGKTLASLRFALHHAKKYSMDRIIYVIPYTSIIDQNAEEVRKFMEDRDVDGTYLNRIVLEHHSNLTPEEETWQQKILAQDWDAPIVFTTSVQILETLFGAGTRSVRRMHQLAKSVIIFDEVQTIPVRCVHMFNNAINFLVKNCGATVVLCTATQPLLDTVKKEKGALKLSSNHEITPDVDQLFSDLNRVIVTDKRKVGGWSSDETTELIMREMEDGRSVLAIVNTRNAAKELYERCRSKTQAEIYHLSTNMCPIHRIQILERIRVCLDPNNLIPVICISTQLIEAGVDVDFGSVIRSVAGLDSIAQAAGRCNRHGYRHTGSVFIINPDFENLDKLKDIKIGREKAERILDEYKDNSDVFDNNILSPKAVARYFKYYFYQRAHEMLYSVEVGHDDNLLSLLSANSTVINDYERINHTSPPIYFKQSFMTAAKAFQTIDSPTRGVIVPYNKGKTIIADLCSVCAIENQYGLIRKAQRYSVNLFPHEWKKLDEEEHAIKEVQEGSGIYYLDERYYSPDFGLSLKPVNKMSFLEI